MSAWLTDAVPLNTLDKGDITANGLEGGSSMKKSRNLLIVLVALFALFLFAPLAFSASFSADILGLPNPSGIAGYTIWLSIGDTFDFSEFLHGDAMPSGQPGQIFGWMDSPAAKIVENEPGMGRVFKFGSSDFDNALSSGTNRFDLENGNLFSFSYDGSIIDLALVQFDPGDGSNLFPDLIETIRFGSDGVTFQAVPIPSAILLLGGGLISLIVVRRRRS
jgi:hypothetical protein